MVSGLIGEDMGVNLMINGAQDYIIKGKLQRLVPAMQRELAEAASRRANKLNQHALHESQHVTTPLLKPLQMPLPVLIGLDATCLVTVQHSGRRV